MQNYGKIELVPRWHGKLSNFKFKFVIAGWRMVWIKCHIFIMSGRTCSLDKTNITQIWRIGGRKDPRFLLQFSSLLVVVPNNTSKLRSCRYKEPFSRD